MLATIDPLNSDSNAAYLLVKHSSMGSLGSMQLCTMPENREWLVPTTLV